MSFVFAKSTATLAAATGSIEDYAREVATAWEVGDAGSDNGVLVVAATGDRELRIETADGVRERFSDDEAERVVEDVLAPAFADERYAQVERFVRQPEPQAPEPEVSNEMEAQVEPFHEP